MSEAKSPASTPAPRGFRMPAEWEPHLGTWMSWPTREGASFPGPWYDKVVPAFQHMAACLLEDENVYLHVADPRYRTDIDAALASLTGAQRARLTLVDSAASEWCRDHGPSYVVDDATALGAIDWRFLSWGGKYGHGFDADRDGAKRAAAEHSAEVFEAPIHLEGGAIEVNGTGTLLTTDTCALHPNRNPQSTRPALESIFNAFLGAGNVIWLHGGLAGDDTDGHVDTVARFVNASTVVVAASNGPSDPNHPILQANLDILREATLEDGSPIVVHQLPAPGPLLIDGETMPASYANFYIANGKVLLPAYGSPRDADALALLDGLFPDRTIVPIDCSALIWGRGAVHCLTQQIPLAGHRVSLAPTL